MHDFLSKLQSSSMARSFALGLSGVVGTYLLQWLSTADFGPRWTPLLAGLLPVLVNWARMQIPAPAAPEVPKPDPLGPLSQEQLQALGGDDEPDRPDTIPFVLPLLLALCIAGVADASPPKAVLVGPTSARPGVPIHLDVTQSAGDIQHYILKVRPETDDSPTIQYAVRTKEEGKAPVVDRSKPFIWGVPGTWEIQLTVVSPDGEADDTSITVTIPGATPCPDPQPVKPQPVTPQPIPVDPAPPRPPAPDPNPAPTPPAPVPPHPVPPIQPDPPPTPPAPAPSRFGIRDRVRTAVLGISSPTRAADAARLRTRLAEIKASAESGALSQQQILDGMVTELKALPGTWQLVKTLASLGIPYLISGKQLQTVQDWVDLLAEILDALAGL